MEQIIKLLEDLSDLQFDKDGDIVLYEGEDWYARIVSARNLAIKYETMIKELSEGIDMRYYEEILEQVGLK